MSRQKNKLRIFYVITSLDYGGTQKNLYYILKTLPRNYNEVEIQPIVISLKKNGRYKQKISSLNVKIHHLEMPVNTSLLTFLFLPYSVIKFFYLVLKYRPRIIHSFLFQANFLSRFVKFFSPKTKIFCSERVVEKQKLWELVLIKYTNFLIDQIITNSKETKEFVVKKYKFKEENVVVVPNIIDLNDIEIKNSPLEIRNIIGIKPKSFFILSVGRLHKQKGFDLLIDIAKEVTKRYEKTFEYLFVVLGDGEDYYKLLNYARKLNVDKYIKFLGYKENVYDFINACDLFLLTSYWEGSPNVVLEALAFEKIVLSTKVEGVSDILNTDYLIDLNQTRQKIIENFVEKIYKIYKNLSCGKYNYKECLNKNFDFYLYSPEFIIKEKFLKYYIDKNYYNFINKPISP